MKKQRIRFKARKKFQLRHNAQFKKLTSGFHPQPRGLKVIDKSRQKKSK